MAATVTVTGVVGAGVALTAGVFPDITAVDFDTVNNVLSLTGPNGVVVNVSITAATTITATKSGSTYTFTVS
jgi:hypothetical protein